MRSSALLFATMSGCQSGQATIDEAVDLETDFTGTTDNQVVLDVSAGGAWDDWAGPGGAIGYVADETAGRPPTAHDPYRARGVPH